MTSAAAGAETEVKTMEEVVVTATRTESLPEGVGGSSVTVVTAPEIEAKNLKTVAEALRTVPSVQVKSSGGLGGQATVFIRGADAKNTLVLIDGVMVNDPSNPNRNADLAHLSTDNIERIEVVRGPMSVLYGSNATAGVVNIITKKGKGKPTVSVGAEAGSYGTWKIDGASSGKIDGFDYSVGISRTESEGFSDADEDNDRIPHAGNTSEDDGWKNTTLSGKFGVELTQSAELEATLRYGESEKEFDDFAWAGYAGDRFDVVGFVQVPNPGGPKEARIDTNQFFGKIDLRHFLFDDRLESSPYYQYGRQIRKTRDNDAAQTSKFDALNQELGWQGTYNFADWNFLTFGASFYEESFDSDTSAKKSATIQSLWISDQLFAADGLVLVAGARNDNHERFGSKVTWRVSPAYTIAATGTTFKAAYGTGFRAPSLYELFADPNPSWLFLGGNPDLEPETSVGWDAGVEQTLFDDTVQLGATYFELNFDDRIIYTGAFPPGFTYQNDSGTTRTQGVETYVSWQPLPNLGLRLDYTHTGAHDPDGDRLVYRPQNEVQINVDYSPIEKLHLNADVRWVDDRLTESFEFDEDGNPAGKLDAYWLVNLAGRYEFNEHLTINARIENLFDEYYEETWSFATPGLSAYGGIRVTY